MNTDVYLLIGWLVGWSVCHNRSQELPSTYRRKSLTRDTKSKLSENCQSQAGKRQHQLQRQEKNIIENDKIK